MSTLAQSRPDARFIYGRLYVPVELVTTLRGREVYHDTYRLFARLASIADGYKAPHWPYDRVILAIWSGPEHVEESGVEALEMMLQTSGLRPFVRAAAKRPGPERVFRTRWSWQFLGEYLGWEWVRR